MVKIFRVWFHLRFIFHSLLQMSCSGYDCLWIGNRKTRQVMNSLEWLRDRIRRSSFKGTFRKSIRSLFLVISFIFLSPSRWRKRIVIVSTSFFFYPLYLPLLFFIRPQLSNSRNRCTFETASDYVEFSNFKSVDRKIPRHCGLKKPKIIESDGDFFRVTFKSNDRFDGTGFQAQYQFKSPVGQFHFHITTFMTH